jgi:hypothetical protein
MGNPLKINDLLTTEDDYLALERAVRSLLIEKNIFNASDFWRKLDKVERTDHTIGAKLIARAWKDMDFRSLLVRDPRAAAHQLLDITLPAHPEVTVLENSNEIHHVIVCTLCSCYPKAVLGLPPSWYKSFAYRSRMVADPISVLREFGTILPPTVELRVVDSTADRRYLVLPTPPSDIQSLSEAEALQRVSRDMMIGVRLPQ